MKPKTKKSPRYFWGKTVTTSTVQASPAETFEEFQSQHIFEPVVLDITRAAYQSMEKPGREAIKKTLPYITPCSFKKPLSNRQQGSALHCNLICIDIDDSLDAAAVLADLARVRTALAPFAFVIYETISSTRERPRLRVIVAAHEIPLAMYRQAVYTIARRIGLAAVNSESLVPNQPMFLPSLFSDQDDFFDGPILIVVKDGEQFEVKDIAAHTDDIVSSETTHKDSGEGDADDLANLRATNPAITLEMVEEMLKHVKANCSRADWLSIAAAMWHQFSHISDEAYEVFDRWSATGEADYVDSDDTLKMWQSLKQTPPGRVPVTIRSLVAMAKAGGWVGSKFPLHMLPPALRDFIVECARVTQVPDAMPAVCCLAVVSASLGSRLRVLSIHGKTTPANLMAAVTALTGSGKSETYRECVRPFGSCQERVRTEWRLTTLPRAKAEKRLLKREMAMLEKSDGKGDRDILTGDIAAKEAALAIASLQEVEPCFLASDFTTPALIRILCRMNGQLFCASPDAKNFVDMLLGRYNEGGTDEEVYLKGFSVEPLDRHRVGDGSQQVEEACITGLWLTQPDKLHRLLASRALSEGGLLPRLLMVQIACPPLRVDLAQLGISDATKNSVYEQVITDLFESFREKAEVHIVDSDEDARQALARYHNDIAERREGELKDVTGFAARWGEYAWRLALVIHAARMGKAAAASNLSLEDAQAGIALAKWFAEQQLDILANGRREARLEKYDRVMKLVERQGGEVRPRDVYRAHITPRDDTPAAVALLDEMVQAGRLVLEERSSGRQNHVQRVYLRPPVSAKAA